MARALTIEDDLPLSLFSIRDLNDALDYRPIVSLEPELFRQFLGRFPPEEILRSTILDLAMESVSCRKPEVLKIILETFPEAKIDPLEMKNRFTETNLLNTSIMCDSLECFKYLLDLLERSETETESKDPFCERNIKNIIDASYLDGHWGKAIKIMIYLLKHYSQVINRGNTILNEHNNYASHSYLKTYIKNNYPITLIRAFIENMPVDIHKNNDELLLLAVKQGDLALTEYFIQLGLSPSRNPEILETAFSEVNYTCYETDYRLVALLLNYGATLDDVSDEYRRRFDEWVGEEAGVRRALVF
jgi:hypothetical protein